MENKFDEIVDICCIGAGRLGAFSMLALAQRYPHKKFQVVDDDIDLINRWNQNSLPFTEPELEDLIAQHRGDNLAFHHDITGAIRQCSLIFLAVEMQTKKKGIGKNGLIEVYKWMKMLEFIRDNANGVKYIVDKSSVPFDVRRTIVDILQPGFAHHVFVNPEFFPQGSSFHTLLNPQRVVFGVKSPDADVTFMHQLYQFVPLSNRIVIGNATAIDFAKKFTNVLLGCMATLANIGTTFADGLGINMSDVLRVVNVDDRLGNGFLRPNVAVGGPALQRDIAYLAYMADEFNHKEIASLFRMFLAVNKKRKEDFVEKMLDTMVSLTDKTIVILGFSFKEGTEDVSDSPAIHICENLLKRKNLLRIYDSIVPEIVIRRCLNVPAKLAQHLQILQLDDDIFRDADAICVMTRAPEFQNINFNDIFQLMRRPACFFDFTGNTDFDIAAMRGVGFQVYSSGRTLQV